MFARPFIRVAALAAGVGVAALGSVGLVPLAHAQWTVTNLHPAGATESYAYGTTGTQQVGYARIGGVKRACLWTGTAASWADLHPDGAPESAAYGTSGVQQVGYVVGHD